MAVVKENEERSLEDLVSGEGEQDDYGFEDITGNDLEDYAEPEPEPEASNEPVDESVEEPVEEPEETVDDEPRQVPEVVDDISVVGDDDGPVDEVAALREQNEALLRHVESLSSKVIGGMTQQQTSADAPQTTTTPSVPQTQAEIMNFLENTSVDDLLEDPTKFNAVLNQVAQRSTQTAVQGAVQQVLRAVPELVMGYITRHSVMNRMVEDFYKENPDLVNVKQTVAAVANDVHAKNPELGVEEVFKQSAEHTRKLLGLKRQAQAAARPKPQKPAFAKAGGARKVAPPIDPIQREINDLLKDDF